MAAGQFKPQEVVVWFHRWLRRKRPHLPPIEIFDQSVRPGNPPADTRLVFEVDAELAAQLRRAARFCARTPQSLAAELLLRGLREETLRAQAEAALATLTPRERQVAWLTVRGRTNQQIAEALVISLETVKTHVRHVLEKFSVRSKADLRLLLLDLGLRWREGERAREHVPATIPPRRDGHHPQARP